MEPTVMACPVCGEATEHRLLKATGNTLTAQCIDCGEVRSMSPPRTRTLELKLIVSHGGEAAPDHLIVDPEDEIAIGDEFDHNGHRMIVTGLEFPEGKRDQAKARDIRVVHAKVFDTVPLKVAVNENEVTKSYRVDTGPESYYQVGEVILVEGRKLLIKTIKSDQNRTLHRGGLPARHIVRVFCDPAPAGAKVGDVGPTRPRGKDAKKATGKKATKRAASQSRPSAKGKTRRFGPR